MFSVLSTLYSLLYFTLYCMWHGPILLTPLLWYLWLCFCCTSFSVPLLLPFQFPPQCARSFPLTRLQRQWILCWRLLSGELVRCLIDLDIGTKRTLLNDLHFAWQFSCECNLCEKEALEAGRKSNYIGKRKSSPFACSNCKA